MRNTDPSFTNLSPTELENLHQAMDEQIQNNSGAFDRDVELCQQALLGTAGVCSEIGKGKSDLAKNRFHSPRLLGYGGYGVVFAVFDRTLDMEVAIKMLRPSRNSPIAQRRFLDEAKISANLTHPGIVRMYDSGTVGDIPYITSGFVGGGSLAELLKKYPNGMPVELASRILLHVANAVAFAHSRLIYHRDIKPSNILIEAAEGNPVDCQTVLTDFGIAKRWDKADSDLTFEGDILGTANYMSPEQASGDLADYSVTSEVFTLGIIFYELLAGVTPFGRKSNSETRQAIRQESHIPLQKRNAKLPRDCVAIVNKCLEKSPEHRYESVSMLAKDLHRFLHGIPVEASSPSVLRMVLSNANKHPIVSGLLMLATLTICASIVGVSYAWWNQYQSAQREYQTKIVYVMLFGKLIDDVVAGDKDQQTAVLESLKEFRDSLEPDVRANPNDSKLKHLLSLVLHYQSITLFRSMKTAESLKSRIESVLILKELRDQYPNNSKFRFQYLNGIATLSYEYDEQKQRHSQLREFQRFENATKCSNGIELAEQILLEVDQLLRDFDKPIYVDACNQFRLDIARLIRNSEFSRAERLIQQTIADSEQLALRHPKELTYIKPAVIGHWRLAINSAERGRMELAVTQAATASAYFEAHLRIHFDKPWVRVLFFENELLHAELLNDAGHLEPAVEVVRQCLPIIEEMSEQDAFRIVAPAIRFRLWSVEYISNKKMGRESAASIALEQLHEIAIASTKTEQYTKSGLAYAERHQLPESIFAILKRQP